MEDRILLSQEEGVAHVRLNRPDKRNGLDHAMFEALAKAGESLRGAAGLRAVVLSGEGSVFCAGLDFKAFMSMGPDAIPKLLTREPGEIANLAQKVAWVWRELPVPVLAALHGVAYGGGLQVALAADLRYAAPDTRLSVMEIRYGIIPDMGASKTMLPLVRDDIARELVYTGRVFDAEEGYRYGLVTEVTSDPIARATEVAKTIAANALTTIVANII